ncbi:hypothetical protein [Gymnodinialimonas hymeniacidonis]|uniref:hypothetical protein n=1 Tax=Gymnodinialimonas hymeniacidonis TaxID=3126508 RepID=UPI0034C5E7C6
MSHAGCHITAWRRSLFAALGLLAMTFAGAADAQAPSVGSAEANPAVLARLFAATCIESGALAEAQALLANAGMVPNPETGTYFHQQFDMSVNPSGELCSMVFSVADAAAVADVFRASAAAVVGGEAADIEIRQLEGNADQFFRASVEARW